MHTIIKIHIYVIYMEKKFKSIEYEMDCLENILKNQQQLCKNFEEYYENNILIKLSETLNEKQKKYSYMINQLKLLRTKTGIEHDNLNVELLLKLEYAMECCIKIEQRIIKFKELLKDLGET